MAVDDFLSRDTDTFVLPQKAYYPTKIPIAHYQLRHFISCPEPDLIYYASGTDVYCLNAATRTQAHVASLPWDARCTSSGHGYVCVSGAEHGNFAAIKVTGFPPTGPSDVDASLPLDFEHRLPRPPQLASASRIHLEKIGEDIVNSISIHKLPAQGNAQEDVVAVLTNNDRTVRLYSLVQNRELTVLNLPFAMNHATVSPDGQMMVAVGDSPIACFFQRVGPVEPTTKTLGGWTPSNQPEWGLFTQVILHRPADSRADGYFTTAWSPSGRLCAVGSECGYITVFDVEMLKLVQHGGDGEDAIVQLISSTRPDNVAGPGAVRTMHFSPAPWDFLVWSEDQGRVCVADLRAGLKVRQTLTLDAKAEGIDKVDIADFNLNMGPEEHDLGMEADFIRRYRRALDSEGTSAAVNAATEYFEADSERQRMHRRLGVVESDNDPSALNVYERGMLEIMRNTRRRDEARESTITPRSINYTSPGHRNTEPESSAHVVTDAMIENFRRERGIPHPARVAPEQERSTPRRQASVIISIDEGTVNAPPGALTHITDSAITRSPNTVPAHARRVNDIITSTDDAWRTIEEALAGQARAANRSTTQPQALNNFTTTPELRSDLRRLRQLTQVRERLRNVRASQAPAETYEFSLGVRRPRPHDFVASLGIPTTGLAMSQDGRTLYCGTTEGIFEFKMNLHVRKACPAITPR